MRRGFKGDDMSIYTTAQGDTWDQIALKCYGSELQTKELMAVNGLKHPGLLRVWRFCQGVQIEIPEIPESAALDELPAWRRGE